MGTFPSLGVVGVDPLTGEVSHVTPTDIFGVRDISRAMSTGTLKPGWGLKLQWDKDGALKFGVAYGAPTVAELSALAILWPLGNLGISNYPGRLSILVRSGNLVPVSRYVQQLSRMCLTH